MENQFIPYKQALKWNLEMKQDYIENDKNWSGLTNFIEEGTMLYGDNGEFRTYEDALEFGLQLGLKMIK